MTVPTGRQTAAGGPVVPDLRPPDVTVFGPVGVDPSTLPGAVHRDVVEVTATVAGDVTTVRVHGELLQETAAHFTAAVADLTGDVVVDLSVTSFMDSTGLGCLVTLRNELMHRGGSLRVVQPEVRVFRLFELTRLDGFFEFVDAV